MNKRRILLLGFFLGWLWCKTTDLRNAFGKGMRNAIFDGISEAAKTALYGKYGKDYVDSAMKRPFAYQRVGPREQYVRRN